MMRRPAVFEPPTQRPSHAVGGSAPDDGFGRTVAISALVIVTVELPFILALLWLVGAPWRIVLTVAGMALLIPPLVIGCLLWLIWWPWARKFPPRPILPSAVTRTFQSFAFGPLERFNNCLRISADEDHLHLEIPLLLRAFGFLPRSRARLSIPWPQITHVRRGGMPGMMRATLASTARIAGPAWCLSLAEPQPE